MDAHAQIDPNDRHPLLLVFGNLVPIDQCVQQDSAKGPPEMAVIASETALQHLKSLYPYGEITSSSDGDSCRIIIMRLTDQCAF